MNEKELTILVNNEKEWRKELWKKLEKLEEAQNTTDNRVLKLELKNAFFGGFFGIIGGALINFFKTH